VKYDPENREAHVDIAEILLRGHRFADAKAKAEAILEKWPVDSAAQLVLAESQIALGGDREARQLLEGLLGDSQSNPRAMLDMAALDFRAHNIDKALEQLQRVWELTPDKPAAALLLSTVFESKRDYTRAEQVLQEALKRSPGSLQPRYALAGLYLRTKRVAQSEEMLREVEQLGSKESQNRAVLAQFYASLSRWTDAEAEYKRVLANYPNDAANWRRLAELYLFNGRRAEANTIVDRLIKLNAGDWESQLLSGRIDLAEGNSDSALLHFHTAQKSNPEAAPVYFSTAQAYLVQGNSEQAKSALHEAVHRQPNYPAARLLLDELEMRTGDADHAIQDLLSASTDHRLPQFETELLLSQAYSVKGQFDLADQTLTRMIERNAQKQDNALIMSNLGWIRLQRGRAQDAEKLASLALKANPRSEQALYLIGVSYLVRKQPAKALDLVTAHVSRDQDWAAGYNTIGKVALQSGKSEQAEQAFKKALELQPGSFSPQLGLAETYSSEHKMDQAHDTYEQLAKQFPNAGFIRMRLGQLESDMGQWQSAIASYKSSIALDPNNAVAKNNLAWAYVEHGGDLDLALKLAQEAREANPQDPSIADTLGWILAKKGAYEMAAQNFRLSLEKKPGSSTYMYHLGLAYYKMGRFTQAREELGKALSVSGFADAEQARALLAEIPQS
jgi:tetratricopeptide (TPR) repeat protein